MTSRWGRSSPLWIAGSAAVSGVSTYGLLAVIARGTTHGGYDAFSFYWSTALIASFGLYLPIEQVVARRRVALRQGRQLMASALRQGVLSGVVVTAVLGILLLTPIAPRHLDGVQTIAAFGLTAVGYTLQFAARGSLAGTHQMRGYALVVTTDSFVRLGLAVALATGTVREAGAYMGAVGLSALVTGALGLGLARRSLGEINGSPLEQQPSRSLAREAWGLSAAMILMQLLLNSPVLIAGHLHDARVSAGLLLAVTALARIPVFLAQAAQATYVSRIAAAMNANRTRHARRIVEVVAGVVVAIAALTVVAAAWWGPRLVSLLFGSGFSASRLECALCALGVAAYLCASVANDISVALNRHAWAALNWALGAAAGATAVVGLHGIQRVTLPLIIGAGVTALLIGMGAARSSAAPRSRRSAATSTESAPEGDYGGPMAPRPRRHLLRSVVLRFGGIVALLVVAFALGVVYVHTRVPHEPASTSATFLEGSKVHSGSPPATGARLATDTCTAPARGVQKGVAVLWRLHSASASNAALARDMVTYAKSLHANAISLNFLVSVSGPKGNVVYPGPETPTVGALRQVIVAARAAHLRVALRPLIDETNIPRPGWRGTLRPTSRPQWFASYGSLMTTYASLAQSTCAAELVIGAELDSLQADTADWTQVLGAVRAAGFKGEVSYASNWDLPGKLPFTPRSGLDFYPALHVSEFATTAQLTDAMVATLHKMPASFLRSLVIQETGVSAYGATFHAPALWSPGSAPTFEKQATWFTAVCRAAQRIHADGLYYWGLDTFTDPLNPNPGTLGTFAYEGRPAADAVRQCFSTW